jgi:hypothetical protein
MIWTVAPDAYLQDGDASGRSHEPTALRVCKLLRPPDPEPVLDCAMCTTTWLEQQRRAATHLAHGAGNAGGTEPHQKGPDTPYFHATLDDCSRVAAQVQCDTMSTAIRPVLMVRPAQLNCSLDVRVPPNLQSPGRHDGQWHDTQPVLYT